MTDSATAASTRVETDTMGPVDVPADRYWGAQTQRSLENFRIGGERMPEALIRALGVQKKAAAQANMALGELDGRIGAAIVEAARTAGAATGAVTAAAAQPLALAADYDGTLGALDGFSNGVGILDIAQIKHPLQIITRDG